jgi:hypothetical protein
MFGHKLYLTIQHVKEFLAYIRGYLKKLTSTEM